MYSAFLTLRSKVCSSASSSILINTFYLTNSWLTSQHLGVISWILPFAGAVDNPHSRGNSRQSICSTFPVLIQTQRFKFWKPLKLAQASPLHEPTDTNFEFFSEFAGICSEGCSSYSFSLVLMPLKLRFLWNWQRCKCGEFGAKNASGSQKEKLHLIHHVTSEFHTKKELSWETQKTCNHLRPFSTFVLFNFWRWRSCLPFYERVINFSFLRIASSEKHSLPKVLLQPQVS